MGEKGARLIPTSEAFCADVVERLEPIGGISSRKMFGGFGVFHRGVMFGIVSKMTLFLKADETTVEDFRAAGSKQHAPMPYYAVPAEAMNDSKKLHRWVRAAIAVAQNASTPKMTRASSAKATKKK